MNSIFFFVVAVLGVSLSQGFKAEQELTSKLLDKYDNRVLPSNDAGDPIRVEVGIYLLKFVHVDEAQGDVDMGVWVGMGWNDSRLSWDSSSKVKQLVVPSKSVWTPDMTFYTGDGAVEETLRSSEKFNAIIQPSGEMYYIPPVNKKVNCIHKTKDGLSCTFELGSWSYDKRFIILQAKGKNEIDTSLLGTYIDQKYKIKSATFEVKDFTYPDEPTVVWSLIKAKINL